jgi:histidyl-tRNA synthetase
LPFSTADQLPLLAIVVHRTKTVSQALAAVTSSPSSDPALNDDAHLVVAAQRLSRQLRDCGLRVLLGSATMLNSAATKKQLELAVKLNATGVVFLGDDSSSTEATSVSVPDSNPPAGSTSSELYAALRTASTPESKQQAAQALVAHLIGTNASVAPQLQTFSYKDLRTRAQSDKQAWTSLPTLLQPAL